MTRIKLNIQINNKDTIVICKEMENPFKLKEIQSDKPTVKDVKDFINVNLFNK